VTVKPHFTGIWLTSASYDMTERGFTCPVFADQRVNLASP
jgi:hypothetical protein